MSDLTERLRSMPCGLTECTDGAIPHGPTPDGQWEAEQCQICAYINEAADALEAKDAEIERLEALVNDGLRELERCDVVIDAARVVSAAAKAADDVPMYRQLREALDAYDKG